MSNNTYTPMILMTNKSTEKTPRIIIHNYCGQSNIHILKILLTCALNCHAMNRKTYDITKKVTKVYKENTYKILVTTFSINYYVFMKISNS